MKIPEKLRILGHDYDVKILDDTGSDDNLGRHKMRMSQIIINARQSDSQREATFLHEILEALNANLELELDHKVISCLEAGLYQVLSDNEMLV